MRSALANLLPGAGMAPRRALMHGGGARRVAADSPISNRGGSRSLPLRCPPPCWPCWFCSFAPASTAIRKQPPRVTGSPRAAAVRTGLLPARSPHDARSSAPSGWSTCRSAVSRHGCRSWRCAFARHRLKPAAAWAWRQWPAASRVACSADSLPAACERFGVLAPLRV